MGFLPKYKPFIMGDLMRKIEIMQKIAEINSQIAALRGERRRYLGLLRQEKNEEQMEFEFERGRVVGEEVDYEE